MPFSKIFHYNFSIFTFFVFTSQILKKTEEKKTFLQDIIIYIFFYGNCLRGPKYLFCGSVDSIYKNPHGMFFFFVFIKFEFYFQPKKNRIQIPFLWKVKMIVRRHDRSFNNNPIRKLQKTIVVKLKHHKTSVLVNFKHLNNLIK